MSSKLDIFDRLASSKGSESGDIFDRLANQSKSLGHEGKIAGGQVGGALETAAKHPGQIFKEIPVALLQQIEAPVIHGPQFIAKLMQGLLGQPSNPEERETFLSHLTPPQKTKIASQLLADYVREGLPEELKGGAQDIADLETLLLPFLKKLLPSSENLAKLGEIPKKPISAEPGGEALSLKDKLGSLLEKTVEKGKEIKERFAPEGEIEKFESGVPKPRAVEAKNRAVAIISKDRQRKVLSSLDEEGQKLIHERIKEHVPLAEKIREGFDFEDYHEREFGKLKHAAEKFNPEIDSSPLRRFFSETRKKYRGIPEPHSDAKAILREMQAFSKRLPEDLNTLLKIRRSNGQKLKNIYENRLLGGTRQEYVDFINKYNKKIDKSIKETLPEDSAWFKQYESLNNEYGKYKMAQSTLEILEPLLREKLNTSALTKLAEQPRAQEKLAIRMGEEGAGQVIQIAKDLKKARDSIKDMTVQQRATFDAIYPITWLFKPAGIAATAQKGYKYARKGYGYYLSEPAVRKSFDNALKAVADKNVPAYKLATEELKE